MSPISRDLRRWTRLRPEILTRCQVRIVEGHRKTACRLDDLSPGGVGVLVDDRSLELLDPVVMLEIRFKGQPPVVRAAELRRTTERPDGLCLGFAWRMVPAAWNGEDRRNQDRLSLPSDELLARMPLRHAHNIWTRLSVVDINSDFGLQVETRGGPAYLLPGHLAKLHLDLPHLHQRGWDCQILWIRPSDGQAMRMGLRVLDPDITLDEILSEWLQIRRECSPVQLKNLGFGKDSLPGQYRFRKVEEITESRSLARFLDDMSKRDLRTGMMERRHKMDHENDQDALHVGCWDGQRLVAAMTLDVIAEDAEDHGYSEIANFAIEPNWLVPEVFLGLWEQTIRLFLASQQSALMAWCPSGREKLFQLLGLHETSGLELPGNIGTWMKISRDRIVSGTGMNAIRWAILYSGVSDFVLQHQGRSVSLRQRLARWRRLGIFALFRDWREPVERRKLREAIELWATKVRDQSTGHLS